MHESVGHISRVYKYNYCNKSLGDVSRMLEMSVGVGDVSLMMHTNQLEMSLEMYKYMRTN